MKQPCPTTLLPLLAAAIITVVSHSCSPPGEVASGGSATAGSGAGKSQIDIQIPVPDFSLVDQSGTRFGLRDLLGKVWIANFMFTECPTICPMQTAELAMIQERLKKSERWEDIRLVSFSVDPENDTPAVLAEYADRHKADPSHWKFLTGTRRELWDLCEGGFKLPVDDAPGNAAMPITHSTRFVLVDRRGTVRGYFEGLDIEGREDLMQAMDGVLKE